MKILVFTSLLFYSIQSSAQLAVPNIISHEDFNKISVDGITIRQIAATNGQESAIKWLYESTERQKLTSMASEESTSSKIRSGSYYVQGKKIRLGFASNLNVEGGFTRMEILSNEVSVSICGVPLQIGGSIEQLSKFQKNEKYQNFLFIPQSNQNRVFSVRYNKETEKITEISFYVMT